MMGISAGFKWLGGLILAGLGVAATASLGHLTVYGELPAWMAKSLALFLSFLSMTAPFSLWEVFSFIIILAGVAIGAILWISRYVENLDAQIEELSQKLSAASLENLQIKAENNDLKTQPKSLPDDPPDLLVLTDRQHKVMMAIAECENGDSISIIENLLALTGLSKVDLMSSLDDLADIQYVQRIRMGWMYKYQLTPTGRKYVIRDSHVTMD